MNNGEFYRARDEMGLTQQEMAEELDVSRMTVLRYEDGLAMIPKKVALATKYLLNEHRKMREESAKILSEVERTVAEIWPGVEGMQIHFYPERVRVSFELPLSEVRPQP